MPLLPLINQYSRYIPVLFKKNAIANGVAIATVYCKLAIAVHIVLQDPPLARLPFHVRLCVQAGNFHFQSR